MDKGCSRRPKAIFSSLLAAVFFLTNVLGAHAAESSLWSERRSAARRARREAAPVPDGPSARLLAQVPEPARLPPYPAADFFTAAGSGAPQGPVPPAVPAWLSDSILPYGSIQSLHLSRNPAAPLIIHIQDAHEVEEAQKNTASMIDAISSHAGTTLVGMEGAEGPFDPAPYRAWPDKDVTRQIAGYFLKTGYLGGAEYAAITLPKPPVLWGVENLGLYLDNVKAYQDAAKLKPAVDKWLQDLDARMESLKERVYSKDLLAFDSHDRAFNEQRESLGDHVSALFSLASPGEKKACPQLARLLQALAAEKSLDFNRADRERLQLVEALSGRLTRGELDALVQKSLDYRAGRAGYAAFHGLLLSQSRAHGISLEAFGQFKAYGEYLLLAERIDRNALLSELDHLEESVPRSLARTPAQKALVSSVRNVALLRKLAHQAMTASDWAAYSNHRDDILRVSRSAGLNGPAPDLAPFESFCRLALRRNQALAGNLLAEMKKEHAKTAFLIAGGFHTAGLTEILRAEDVSTIVVTPKIAEVPKENHSLDVFSRQPAPLEKLFAGEKIFLVSWRLLSPGNRDVPGAAPRVRALEGVFASLEAFAEEIEDQDPARAESLNHLISAFKTIGEGGLKMSRRPVRRGGLVTLGFETRDGRTYQLAAVPAGAGRPAEGSPAPLAELELSIGGQTFNVRLEAARGLAPGLRDLVSAARAGLDRRLALMFAGRALPGWSESIKARAGAGAMAVEPVLYGLLAVFSLASGAVLWIVAALKRRKAEPRTPSPRSSGPQPVRDQRRNGSLHTTFAVVSALLISGLAGTAWWLASRSAPVDRDQPAAVPVPAQRLPRPALPAPSSTAGAAPSAASSAPSAPTPAAAPSALTTGQALNRLLLPGYLEKDPALFRELLPFLPSLIEKEGLSESVGVLARAASVLGAEDPAVQSVARELVSRSGTAYAGHKPELKPLMDRVLAGAAAAKDYKTLLKHGDFETSRVSWLEPAAQAMAEEMPVEVIRALHGASSAGGQPLTAVERASLQRAADSALLQGAPIDVYDLDFIEGNIPGFREKFIQRGLSVMIRDNPRRGIFWLNEHKDIPGYEAFVAQVKAVAMERRDFNVLTSHPELFSPEEAQALAAGFAEASPEEALQCIYNPAGMQMESQKPYFHILADKALEALEAKGGDGAILDFASLDSIYAEDPGVYTPVLQEKDQRGLMKSSVQGLLERDPWYLATHPWIQERLAKLDDAPEIYDALAEALMRTDPELAKSWAEAHPEMFVASLVHEKFRAATIEVPEETLPPLATALLMDTVRRIQDAQEDMADGSTPLPERPAPVLRNEGAREDSFLTYGVAGLFLLAGSSVFLLFRKRDKSRTYAAAPPLLLLAAYDAFPSSAPSTAHGPWMWASLGLLAVALAAGAFAWRAHRGRRWDALMWRFNPVKLLAEQGFTFPSMVLVAVAHAVLSPLLRRGDLIAVETLLSAAGIAAVWTSFAATHPREDAQRWKVPVSTHHALVFMGFLLYTGATGLVFIHTLGTGTPALAAAWRAVRWGLVIHAAFNVFSPVPLMGRGPRATKSQRRSRGRADPPAPLSPAGRASVVLRSMDDGIGGDLFDFGSNCLSAVEMLSSVAGQLEGGARTGVEAVLTSLSGLKEPLDGLIAARARPPDPAALERTLEGLLRSYKESRDRIWRLEEAFFSSSPDARRRFPGLSLKWGGAILELDLGVERIESRLEQLTGRTLRPRECSMETLSHAMEALAARMPSDVAVRVSSSGAYYDWVRGNDLSLVHAFSIFLTKAYHAAASAAPGRQARVDVRSFQEEGKVRIEFSDNGPPPSPDLLAVNPATGRQRFFDAEGLSEAWLSVHDAGGQVEAAAAPSGGTLFLVSLPAVHSTPPMEEALFAELCGRAFSRINQGEPDVLGLWLLASLLNSGLLGSAQSRSALEGLIMHLNPIGSDLLREEATHLLAHLLSLHNDRRRDYLETLEKFLSDEKKVAKADLPEYAERHRLFQGNMLRVISEAARGDPSLWALLRDGIYYPEVAEVLSDVVASESPPDSSPEAAGGSGAVIPSLKGLVAPRMELKKYGVAVAWWLEESLFSVLPALAVSVPGMGPWTPAVLAAARGVFFLLHLPGPRDPSQSAFDRLAAPALASLLPFLSLAAGDPRTMAQAYVLIGLSSHLAVNLAALAGLWRPASIARGIDWPSFKGWRGLLKGLAVALVLLVAACNPAAAVPPVLGPPPPSAVQPGAVSQPAPLPADKKPLVESLAKGILSTRDPGTGLPVSHAGHPNFGDVLFQYDAAVGAGVLHAAGRQAEAERILDYLAERINIPEDEVRARRSMHGIYGLRVLQDGPLAWAQDRVLQGVLNALNVRSTSPEGQGILEYLVSPGPMAWTGLEMLQVNPQKYAAAEAHLGDWLLAMQDAEGGVRDGNRGPGNVHVEPHLDTLDYFELLHRATGDPKWKAGADKAWDWFLRNAPDLKKGVIPQGVWAGASHALHATDAYTWTVAAHANRLDAATLEALIRTVEAKSLVKIAFTRQDGQKVAVILTDFTDPSDPEVQKPPKDAADGDHRGGYHPLGSPEWASGFALALYEAALREWSLGRRDKAIEYKALARALIPQILETFHRTPDGGLAGPYATGQWVATGHGWRTPIGRQSVAAGWVVFPLLERNPLTGEDLSSKLAAIPDLPAAEGLKLLEAAVSHPAFEEPVKASFPEEATYVWEPGWFLNKAGDAHDGAWGAFNRGDHAQAAKWAAIVIREWGDKASAEEKRKEAEIGGIVKYPWGTPHDDVPELKAAIWRYPLLNEVGAAAWILAAAAFERGDVPEAKKWMRWTIERVPDHQIAADARGAGYWNALVGWERNPGNVERDHRMGAPYREVLSEMGLSSAAPREVPIPPSGAASPARVPSTPPAPSASGAKVHSMTLIPKGEKPKSRPASNGGGLWLDPAQHPWYPRVAAAVETLAANVLIPALGSLILIHGHASPAGWLALPVAMALSVWAPHVPGRGWRAAFSADVLKLTALTFLSGLPLALAAASPLWLLLYPPTALALFAHHHVVLNGQPLSSPAARRLAAAMGPALPVDFDALVPGRAAALRAASRAFEEARDDPASRDDLLLRLREDAAFRADAAAAAAFKKGLAAARSSRLGPDGVVFMDLTDFSSWEEPERMAALGFMSALSGRLAAGEDVPYRVLTCDADKDGVSLKDLGALAPLSPLFHPSARVLQRSGADVRASSGKVDVRATLTYGDLASQSLDKRPVQPVARDKSVLLIEGLTIVFPQYLKTVAERVKRDFQSVLATLLAA